MPLRLESYYDNSAIMTYRFKLQSRSGKRNYNMNPPQIILSFVALTIFQLCVRHRGCVIGNYYGAMIGNYIAKYYDDRCDDIPSWDSISV
jgi:hypothetical protein